MFETTHTDLSGEVTEITVTDQAHHRNGIGGAGFVVSLFDTLDQEGERQHMLGISFMADQVVVPDVRDFFRTHTAVLDLALAADGVIAFGANSWRGADHYGLALSDAWRARQMADAQFPYDPWDER